MRKLLVLVVVLSVIAGGAFVAAGFAAVPVIHINKPEKFVGAATPLDVLIEAPNGRVGALAIEFEQGGTRTSLMSTSDALGQAGVGTGSPITQDGPNQLRMTPTVGRDQVPGLKSGPARIIVTASRPVLYGIRHVQSQATKDVTVRLERPQVSVLSTHHYINVGGAEMVLYRVSPADVASGVRVGDFEYPGYPASGVQIPGIAVADPAVRVAFFALEFDQPTNTPMQLFARDEAGNTATAGFDHQVFPKPARQSKIPLDDAFINRVVPAILAGTNEVAPTGSTIEQYVVVNSVLRKLNAAKIASFAKETSPDLLWNGVVFHPFTNNAVESAFADRRTYVYQGKEVDHQTHLGFDLASVKNAPVIAANRGKVVFAQELGIYGNCVIVDHGMGVQSLYGHMSSIGVRPGDMVEKAQELGKSGITGLAGGDHLHFTMLVNGHMINPVEWWDAHWIEDRILRKLRP